MSQSYDNHAKFVTGYHFVAMPLLLSAFLWSVRRALAERSVEALMQLALRAATILMHLYIRLFPLTVQDRLIRLEETLRMRDLVRPELHPRLGEIRRHQFVALRFASDDELPGLVERVLAGELRTAEQIKLAIRDWRADHLRV